MVDMKFISSQHIEKLGHPILEIRERGLFNIISKLDNGVLFDNDLARSRELLNKLFKWFLFEPCSQEEVVFTLLKRILKSESGKSLINHLGKYTLRKDLNQIRSYLEPQYYPHLNELAGIIDQQEVVTTVPPLECEVPLSYRTGNSENAFSLGIGSTATLIEGYIDKGSSAEPQTGAHNLADLRALSVDPSTYRLEETAIFPSNTSLPNYYFDWQPLVEPDRHVLQSVESSLTNPPQPSALLHSCEFFTNVLLHDFPAEIFLQRPAILLEFFALMTCGSNRITNAVLNCLNNLTKALRVRISHYNDAAMRNLKTDLLTLKNSIPGTPASSVYKSSDDGVQSEVEDTFEKPEVILMLQREQLSTPKFCYMALSAIFNYLCVGSDVRETKVKTNQSAINFCLLLLEELLNLLSLTVRNEIWDQKQTEITLSVLKGLNEVLVRYGEALEYFRLESVISEACPNYRVIYLYLVHNCANLLKKIVPISKTGLILPRNLKVALMNCLLDVTLGRLYPTVHSTILNYVQSFHLDGDLDTLKKYKDVKKICQGMTSTVKFLNHHLTLSTWENIRLAVQALPSLEFHKEFDFLKVFVEMCSEHLEQICDDSKKLSVVEEVVLSLLSHGVQDIKKEMYRLCQKKVIANIGPKLNMSGGNMAGSQISFLLSSKVLVEIAAFGLTSESLEIQRCAEDILIYILKCKILVCEYIWNKVVQALISSLPIIACHADKNSNLGKTILSLTDPDTARDIFFPPIVMLKCNVQFLFLDDSYLRDEAFSRICWLLSSQESSREMLPRFNTLYDTSLTGIFKLKRTVDVNKVRRTEHFYQPSSLQQVMEVLNSPNIEPIIRRSALNQVSVMIEDPLLDQIFLDMNGLEIVAGIMKTALTESDYRDYPDSVVPIISILKNLSFYNGSVREELSVNIDVIYCILRGLFLFFTEERLKQDATILLFIIIFKDFMKGNPSNANLSLPDIVCKKMRMPFICNTHWRTSEYTKETIKGGILSDRWCLSSIQIQWNAEVFGGFEELIKWDEINYDDHPMFHFVDLLKLSNQDLRAIKASSIDYCVNYYLNTIQNGTSHTVVIESIDHLTSYVYFYTLSKSLEKNKENNFLLHPWESSFSRFIKSLPSCDDDVLLLKSVVQFMSVLAPFYLSSEMDCWITSILKDGTQCLLDLLVIDKATDEDTKIIGQELLKLITMCVRHEQHYMDYYTPCFIDKSKPWSYVIKLIADNLKFSDAQHFYNLAYLDSLLSCLVHLTANLGWSNSKAGGAPQEPIPQMISDLCELIGAFHSGKGPSAAVSMMGLSITRHVLLVINHLLAELLHSKAKGWETCFFGYDGSGRPVCSFLALGASRDVVLRAATLQLLSGLATSARAANAIVQDIKMDNANIWELAFTVFVDHNEASVVRENAVQLLANLAGHTMPFSSERYPVGHVPVLKKSCTLDIFNLVEEYDLYNNLDIILNNLFTLNVMDKQRKVGCFEGSEKTGSSLSVNQENDVIVTTPGLIRAVGNFVYNILNLDLESVSLKLQEQGLVKLLFRTLCNPSISISNTRELSLYCDILEMNTVVCSVLARLATCNSVCLGTILHTRDCLNTLFSLLNPKIFHVDLPQLVYLRNKLWSEIFTLIATLIEYSSETEGNLTNRSVEVISIFSETLLELGNGPFIETVCESISCIGSNELQNSALASLSCLLRVETYRTFEKSNVTVDVAESSSLQSLLDSVRTSRTIVISDSKENVKPLNNVKKSSITQFSDKYKMNLLEEAYFGKVFPTRKEDELVEDIEVSIVEVNENALVSGAEICKILLYLYDICDLKLNKNVGFNKKKAIVVAALSGLLCISKEAKNYALQKDLLLVIVKQLKDYHIRLSLESVDCLRRVADKKRVCPMLKDVNDLVGLLTNFMVNDEAVKTEAANLNLADITHKLWVWFLVQNIYLLDVLRMLCTYTTSCNLACQTLPLTSSVAGSGPRKSPSNVSLLHAIISLISKQMDQISKTHDLRILETSFNILHNACESLECRVLLSKGNLFQSIHRLHPAITKRQKPWENIELIWLQFLETYTNYPEGQTAIAKIVDVLELVMTLTASSRVQNRQMALLVLRNISFYHSNKARLLASGEFLNILQTKLSNGSMEEKNIVVVIIWALAANSQKAKIILKSAQLDKKLQDTVKHCQLFSNEEFCANNEELDRMCYVLNMLRDTDKLR